MDFELRDHLDRLHHSIDEFIEFAEESLSGDDPHDESEYSFLVDESGISNTELDNFLETLKHATEFIDQLK